MGVYIPNMKSMFKTCGDCPLDVPNCRLWEELENLNTERHPNCPLIEINLVRCGECEYADEYNHCKYSAWWNGNADFCSHGIRRKESR